MILLMHVNFFSPLPQDLRYGGSIGPDGLDGWHTYTIEWHTGA